jgi:hypothetical protein
MSSKLMAMVRRALRERQRVECRSCDGQGETGPDGPFNPETVLWVAGRPGMMIIGGDGQPREAAVGEVLRSPCSVCNGDGSVLSEVDWASMPKLIRKLADMPYTGLEPPRDDWVGRLLELGGQALLDARDAFPATRVDERGSHSISGMRRLDPRTVIRTLFRARWRAALLDGLHDVINSRGWMPVSTLDRTQGTHPGKRSAYNLHPRWRRAHLAQELPF